jgi:hypothetical protein
MKQIITLLLLVWLAVPVFSAGDAVIPGLYRPESIVVEDSRVYITQGVEVFIFKKSSMELVKKFGAEGEGPREFKKSPVPWIPSITLYKNGNRLVVNAMGKVAYYSPDGEFIEEKTTGTIFARYIPLGKKYIYIYFTAEEKVRYISAALVDAGFKNNIPLSRFKFPAQEGKKRNPILMARLASYFDRYVYRDKFVFISDGNAIQVFGPEGKELTSFTPDYTKVPIKGALKKEIDTFFTNDIRYKVPYLADKSRNLIGLPDHMPIFKDYRLADGKIYILSSFKKDGKYETFIYDFSGKLLKKTFIPLAQSDFLTLYPFDIDEGKIYQLVHDEEEDEYKLTITAI